MTITDKDLEFLVTEFRTDCGQLITIYEKNRDSFIRDEEYSKAAEMHDLTKGMSIALSLFKHTLARSTKTCHLQ